MHINCHAHIFTLHSVLSKEAVRIVGDRLLEAGVPGLVVDGVKGLLEQQLDYPEHFDEPALLRRLLGKIAEATGFQDFLRQAGSPLPVGVSITGDAVEGLPVAVLQTVLDSLSGALAGTSGAGSTLSNVYETLCMAMRPTITSAADQILDQMDPDDALVALMLDVHTPHEGERDRQNFMGQLAGTTEAVLQRPGRVLPFVAVHPDRPDHFQIMSDALANRGFVGVKLYPSLGFEVGEPAMMAVYQYCLEQDVPILQHCSHGGFYASEDCKDYSNPAHWSSILDGDLAALRLCFAHFDGWKSLGTADGLGGESWGSGILDLIRDKPNVFVDISNHTSMMGDPRKEGPYFDALHELLRDERLKERVLFGTDSWIMRLNTSERAFWEYFRQHLSAEEFDQIAGIAPRAFLGFPGGDSGPLRANLRRHVDFLADHCAEVGATPPEWVRREVGAEFSVSREATDWCSTRLPARRTFQYFRRLLPRRLERAPFVECRGVPLRELTYFHPDRDSFDTTVTAEARDFVGYCKSGAEYRGSYTDTSAAADLDDGRYLEVGFVCNRQAALFGGLVLRSASFRHASGQLPTAPREGHAWTVDLVIGRDE